MVFATLVSLGKRCSCIKDISNENILLWQRKYLAPTTLMDPLYYGNGTYLTKCVEHEGHLSSSRGDDRNNAGAAMPLVDFIDF
jgi:hypothetical protein